MPKRKLPPFVSLWANYPSDIHPCNQTNTDGTKTWSNQCAIRMSLTLISSGFHLTNYTEPKCKHGHARGAESLANYLLSQAGMPKIAKTAEAGKKNVAGKKGLVFFKDITGFRGGLGDHFDLWDGASTKTGEYFDSCKQSWFWEVN